MNTKGAIMPNNHELLLKRITADPKVMAGKPVIKGTRLTVQFILGLLADGVTINEILDEYEGLTKEDILACLSYASEAIEHTTYLSLSTEA